jgi:hypothetical protein
MSTTELKSHLYKLLEEIDDEQLLRTVYDFLKESNSDGKFWQTLTEKQKDEIYLSFSESENEENLKSWDELKKKY